MNGNFIDTANVYTNGTSESFLGEFVKGHRESMVLATKDTNAMPGKDPNAAGNHRKSMMQSVEASLKRLQTDYIDLYWVHVWDHITPMEAVMRELDNLVRQQRCARIYRNRSRHGVDRATGGARGDGAGGREAEFDELVGRNSAGPPQPTG